MSSAGSRVSETAEAVDSDFGSAKINIGGNLIAVAIA
jgi:hypothetical protein